MFPCRTQALLPSIFALLLPFLLFPMPHSHNYAWAGP